MTKLDDVRKAIEASLGNLTPAKAQELAKGSRSQAPRRSRSPRPRPTSSSGPSATASGSSS